MPRSQKVKPKSATAQGRKGTRANLNVTTLVSQNENQLESINEYVVSQKLIENTEIAPLPNSHIVSQDIKVENLKKKATSLWRENFKKRNEMGYENYHKLSRQEKLRINIEIKE